MARQVSTDDIRQMNEIYYQCKNYSEVARQTGWSAATVRKYIDKNFVPVVEEEIIRFDLNKDMPKFSTKIFEGVDNYGTLCELSNEEVIEILSLWRELTI